MRNPKLLRVWPWIEFTVLFGSGALATPSCPEARPKRVGIQGVVENGVFGAHNSENLCEV